MFRCLGRLAGSVLLAVLACTLAVRAQDAPAARVRGAAGRALFTSDEPLPVTLIADFKAVNRDRNPSSKKTFPGTIVVARADGGEDRIEVRLRTRGHVRRLSATCTFAPLRIEFASPVSGTIFAGNKALKLGTHCRDADLYEQYVYREYAAYRIYNLLTPRSFRARLARATYVDAASGKPFATRAGLFLEDDDDVAQRLDGRSIETEGLHFDTVDPDTMTLLSLFEYMVGNTDMSLYKLHNIKVVRDTHGVHYPVPYDFDYSGLVNARYAVPATTLNLSSVRERLYRGPCRTAAELEPLLAGILRQREQVLGIFDAVPGLDAGYRKDARNYLEQFFRMAEKPGDVKKVLVDGCVKHKTM